MPTVDVDPQTTVLAPRPAPGEVLILTCDAAGAACWVKVPKDKFGEIAGEMWTTLLDEGTAILYERAAEPGGAQPSPEWALRET
jgi:hypothetical protein